MKILWLKTEVLHPIDKGGKIRTFNMLRELKRDHHITYLTLDDGSAQAADRERAFEYCHELICVSHKQRDKFTPGFYAELFFNQLSSLPYAIEKYRSREMHDQILSQTRKHRFDVLIADFLAPAINLPNELTCPTILFQHNVEAMIWKRHYETQSSWLKKKFLLGQWRKMENFERSMCRRFDSVIAVSREDRELMTEQYEVEAITDVPTGVDTDFFRPNGNTRSDPHEIVFTGSMDWLPNEDAIRYFTDRILPQIRERIPDATLTVVGRNPYPGLVELSQKDPGITVTGRVDDVRPYMERAAVYVVPLRIGGGTRLKIYEAMAMEKPMVSTTVGAEGLPLEHGVELLIADTPDAFANSVIKLLTDGVAAREMAERAARMVRERFGWKEVAQRFAEICEETVRRHREKTSVPQS